MTQWLMLQYAIDRLEAMGKEHVAQVDLDGTIQAVAPIAKGPGKVATIRISGPLLPRRSPLLDFFGAEYTTYGDIEAQIDEAITWGAKRLDFDVDSPGGNINGLYSAMEAVKTAPMKTRAIAGHTMASAAYMLATQADEIIAKNEASLIGSVGVEASAVSVGVAAVTNTDSPKKNPDIFTEEGKSDMREQLDDIFQLYAEKISDGRRVSIETVKKEFGQGAVMTARTALRRKMIDGIAPSRAAAENNKPTAEPAANQGDKMDSKTLKAEHRATYDEIIEIGAKAERERVCAHLVLAEGSGDYDTAHQAIKDGEEMSALVMARHQSAAMKRDLKQARVADNPPDLGAGAKANDEQAQADAKAIADFQALNPGCTVEVDPIRTEVH